MAVGTLTVCECERVCDSCCCFLLLANNCETNSPSFSFCGLFLYCVVVFVFVLVFVLVFVIVFVLTCVCACVCACA